MYLKIIYQLEVKTEAAAKTGDISELLHISPASVTEMLDRLQEEGYVKHEKYRGAVTTIKGKKVARRILQRHCLIERFLIDSLGVKDLDVAHDQADAMEHVLRDEIAMRLTRIVKAPKECPDCYDMENDCCIDLVGKKRAKA